MKSWIILSTLCMGLSLTSYTSMANAYEDAYPIHPSNAFNQLDNMTGGSSADTGTFFDGSSSSYGKGTSDTYVNSTPSYIPEPTGVFEED